VIGSGGSSLISYIVWYIRGGMYFILQMNTAGISEKLIPVHQNIHYHIPEGSYFRVH